VSKLNWQAWSSGGRHQTIDEIKNAISRNDAWIQNYNMFPDVALGLAIVIEESKIFDLLQELNNILSISGSLPENPNSGSINEWLIFMNISFSKGKGDLRINVSEVP